MTRAIITVVGKDTVGIIAKVCSYLADSQINILDISQTIVQEYFNMMMIVDMSKCNTSFDQVSTELQPFRNTHYARTTRIQRVTNTRYVLAKTRPDAHTRNNNSSSHILTIVIKVGSINSHRSV